MKNFIKQTFVLLSTVVATLLLSSGNSYGQKKDSLVIKGDISATRFIGGLDSAFWLTTGSVGDGLSLFNSTKQDTIRVLMLVCDTSGGWHSSMKFISPCAQSSNDGRCVWWQFGYSAIETCGCRPNLLWPIASTCQHEVYVSYLDQNKKLLSKSIIVWMSKEINQ